MEKSKQKYDKKTVITGEDCVLEKEDMALLIEVKDTLADMDEVLEQLAGHEHANGEFIKP